MENTPCKTEKVDELDVLVQMPDNAHGLVPIRGSSIHGTSRKWNPKNMRFLACPECDEIVYNKQALMRHRVEQHKFSPDFKCDLCGIMLTEGEEIRKHIEKHNKEKKYECPVCLVKFTTDTSLIRHIRYKHTNERKYKCSLCSFAAVEHCKLQEHIRKHTGETPFMCKECGATFKSKVSLTRHRTTHLKTREYICTLCFQQFAISNGLRTHLRLVHSVSNAAINGVNNTRQHGVPPELAVFLNTLEKNLEEFGKLRYYVIKDEYKADLTLHFKNISPLLTDEPLDNTIYSFPEYNNLRSGDVGFAPHMGRPRKTSEEAIKQHNTSKRSKAKRNKGGSIDKKLGVVTKQEPVETNLKNASPEGDKKRKKQKAERASPRAKKQMLMQENQIEQLHKMNEVLVSGNAKNNNSDEASTDVEGNWCQDKEETSCQDKEVAIHLSGNAAASEVNMASSLIQTTEASSVPEDVEMDDIASTVTAIGSDENGNTDDPADIDEELQEERVYEFEYVDNLDGKTYTKETEANSSPEERKNKLVYVNKLNDITKTKGKEAKSAPEESKNKIEYLNNLENNTNTKYEKAKSASVDVLAETADTFTVGQCGNKKKHDNVEVAIGSQQLEIDCENKRIQKDQDEKITAKTSLKDKDEKIIAKPSLKGKDEKIVANTSLETEASGAGSQNHKQSKKANIENICTRLTDDKQLQKLKTGGYGKRPQVIEVLEDGTVVDITEDYLEHLPMEGLK